MRHFFVFLILISTACQGSGETTLPPGSNTDSGLDDLRSNDLSYSDVIGQIDGCGIQDMYTALEPTCANCHRTGTTPYFASGTTFYRLLVDDPQWIVPGEPENSGLVDLLVGKAKGQYKQMPLGTKTYDQLAKENDTLMSVDGVRDFITELKGCTPTNPKTVEKVLVRRKSARQIFNTLKQHVGIVDEDIRNTRAGNYPIWSPDDVQTFTDGVNDNRFNNTAARRWHALGGESYLVNIRPTTGLTPTFGQTIVQVSQAWCRDGVNKDNNTALFRHVIQSDLAAASDAEIKQNVEYLMLRFWGHVATPEEIDNMFNDVYSFYSQAEDPRTAWTAVCAALIRDPLWLVY